MSLAAAHELCELLPLMERYFLAVGLSQGWYVKGQSPASVTSVLAAWFSIGLCFGPGRVGVSLEPSPSAERPWQRGTGGKERHSASAGALVSAPGESPCHEYLTVGGCNYPKCPGPKHPRKCVGCEIAWSCSS